MKTVMLQLRTPTGFYGAGLSWQIIIGLKEGRGSTHLKIKGTERIRGKGPRKAHVTTRTFSIFGMENRDVNQVRLLPYEPTYDLTAQFCLNKV